MGLIKKNYIVDNLGIAIDDAYAKIVVLTSEKNGKSVATFQIRKAREDFVDNVATQPLKQVSIQFVADKNIPLWKQGYDIAKASEEFIGWEDDIVI